MPNSSSVLGIAFIALASLSPIRLCAQAVPSPTSTGVSAPLDLRAITGQTLLVNPSARVAQQKLLEAQAKLAEAAAQRRMQLTFSGTASGSHGQVAQPVSTQTFGTVEGTIALPLPNGGRLAALYAQAEGTVRAAQAGLDRARLDLAFRASDAYFGVLRSRGARDIAAENVGQAERQVADTQKRVDAGDLPQADVLKAEVPLAAARVALARAQTAARVAEQELNSLLVRDLASSVDISAAPSLPALTMTREQIVSQALARSPDVREAHANLDSAEAALQLARHAHDPEWTVQATHARTSDITAYSSLSTVSLNVNLPLGDGGVARQQVKQAQAQLEQARSSLTLARQEAQLGAEQAFLQVEAEQANVTGTQETVRIATESLAKAQQAYAAGLTTTRDVLDAQLALAQARNEANSAVYDLDVARAKLDQAIGKEPTP